MPDTATRTEVTYDDVRAALRELSDLIADLLDTLAEHLDSTGRGSS